MPKKADRCKLIIDVRASVCSGAWAYEAASEESPVPVGTVYARWTVRPGEMEILRSEVVHYYRREGVRSAINDFLIVVSDVKRIVTHTGTKSGAAFMRAYGYRESNGYWVYDVTPARRANAIARDALRRIR